MKHANRSCLVKLDVQERRRSLTSTIQTSSDDLIRDERFRLGIEGSGLGTWDLDLSTKELIWADGRRQRYASHVLNRCRDEVASSRAPGWSVRTPPDAPNALVLSNRWQGLSPGVYTDFVWRPAGTLPCVTRPATVGVRCAAMWRCNVTNGGVLRVV